MTRLYRAEHPRPRGHLTTGARRGRYFTDAIADARGYLTKRGWLVYVDVADVEAYADVQQPVDGRGRHYLLPRELADTKQAL